MGLRFWGNIPHGTFIIYRIFILDMMIILKKKSVSEWTLILDRDFIPDKMFTRAYIFTVKT